MSSIISTDALRLMLNRLRERLWVKPLAICLLSIIGAAAARLADGTALATMVPDISVESIDSLLSVMATSMLVIATFAVASMVSAYASASNSATPRAITLVISDGVSQNALSTFIGAFIFSVVGLITVGNNYFGAAGRFTLFVLTVFAFVSVVFTFVRWVDSIARLGRLTTTIDKVEEAATGALNRRRDAPTMHGLPIGPQLPGRVPAFAQRVGHVQHIDLSALQECAEKLEGRIIVAALPGAFVSADRVLAYVTTTGDEATGADFDLIGKAFRIGGERRFDDDPRFGLVVLSEIAGRALSPAVNDPGTAIDVLGTLVRLFAVWTAPPKHDHDNAKALKYDRVEVPTLVAQDLFDDAFTAIARDGASTMEVALRLQKSLHSLANTGGPDERAAAIEHSRSALARAEQALSHPADLERVRAAAAFAQRSEDAVSNAASG